jgi:uncharacterized protein YndB with AHSA1/START domain
MMERKTKVEAGNGQQDIVITREFDLPLSLLFKAYTVPELFEQWMNTKVLKMDNRPHGSWQFETSGPDGNVAFRANGTIHEFVPEQKITRTFEMENTPFPVQLEFLEFEALPDNRSRLNMQIVYRSEADRNQMLQLPFAAGLNMAHDRLQEVLNQTN